jgi:Tol biopolymer transport system component
VFGAVVGIAAVVLIARALDERARPADPPTPTPDTALRRGGEVITFTGVDPWSEGDLVAQYPDTGAARTLIAADRLGGPVDVERLTVGSAAWSPDDRSVAYEIVTCVGGFNAEAGDGGLWVRNGADEPRQLTRPCSEKPDVHGLWAWSPVAAQLVAVEGGALFLIDPATGERTDLGEPAADITALGWSPDGKRIAYGTQGGSVYSVSVGGGDHSRLASSLGYVYGGLGGFAITWSPDGAHIAVHALQDDGEALYVMNADGSDLHQLAEDAEIQGVYFSPGLSWSPDGTQMAYATFSGRGTERRMQIWTGSPDGSTRSLLYESAPAPIDTGGSPVWSPDGARIAFEIETTDGEVVWLVVNADGTGNTREIDELRYLSWRGGWYFCECYG